MLFIKESVYKALSAHAVKAYPNECCGALLGRLHELDWQIEESIEACNISTLPQTRYGIASSEVVKIEREARQRALSIAGFYHSHPDSPATWSQTDLREAHWHGCIYLITSVRQGRAFETNAFLLTGTTEDNKNFETLDIQLLTE